MAVDPIAQALDDIINRKRTARSHQTQDELAKQLGLMADACVSAKLGPSARFFSRERVDELVQLLRDAEGAIIVLKAEIRRLNMQESAHVGRR